jgi:hypothetical protein
MTAFAQTLRSGLIWVVLLIVLPGMLYAMAESPDHDGFDGSGPYGHPSTCGVCHEHRGTHLPNVIDGRNVYVHLPESLRTSIN